MLRHSAPIPNPLILSQDEEQMRSSKTRRQASFTRFEERLPGELLQTFGPTDAALPYPLHLTLVIEEKRVMHAKVEPGWLHQGIEKAAETLSWLELPDYLTRLSPRTPATLALGAILAIEELVGIQHDVPLLAQAWRVVMLEASRLQHHLDVCAHLLTLCAPAPLAHTAHEIAHDAYSLHSKALRDPSNQPRWGVGKLRQGLTQTEIEALQSLARVLEKRVRQLTREMSADSNTKVRLQGLAAINKETALSHALTGPTLRACGVLDDVRRSHPYFDYLNFPPALPTREGGDAYARMFQRMEEALASLELVDKVTSSLLSSRTLESAHFELDLSHINWENLPAGSSTSYIEAPEGEQLITLIARGGANPNRVHLRSPSFAQSAALPTFLKNVDIDDAVLALHSLGINGLEVDR